MAEQTTKALFTCTEAGYEMATVIMDAYRASGMYAVFFGIADESMLVELGEMNGMTHVLHFVDDENIKLVSLSDEMGGYTVDVKVSDLLLMQG
ncbi:MAG: hypothetical protein IKT73_09355 [Anaerotignum sp.]|nr:hypothetical protein [Anaerotignum sp.]